MLLKPPTIGSSQQNKIVQKIDFQLDYKNKINEKVKTISHMLNYIIFIKYFSYWTICLVYGEKLKANYF